MNKSTILPDALTRFRHAASQYARTAKLRASRLLALKEEIAALRKRGVKILTPCAARGIETSAGRVSAVVTEHGTNALRTAAQYCVADDVTGRASCCGDQFTVDHQQAVIVALQESLDDHRS